MKYYLGRVIVLESNKVLSTYMYYFDTVLTLALEYR